MNLKKYFKNCWLPLLAIILWLVTVNLYWPKIFGTGDQLTYAVIARNIARGVGAVHQTTTPLQIFRTGHFPQHDTSQFLGWSIVEAGFFKVLGASDWVIVLASGVFWWLGLMMLLKLSTKIFSRKTATLAGLLYLTQPYLLKMSFSGLTEPLFVFLFLLFLILIFEKKYYLLNGIIWGWLGITRGIIFFLLPAVVWLMWRNKISKINLIKLVIGWLFVTLTFKLRELSLPSDGYQLALLIPPADYLNQIRQLAEPKPDKISFLAGLTVIAKHWFEQFWLWGVASYAFFIFGLGIFGIKWQNNWAKFTILALIGYFGGMGIADPVARYAIPIIILFIPLTAELLNQIKTTKIKYFVLTVVIFFPLLLAVQRHFFITQIPVWQNQLINQVQADKTIKTVISDDPGVLSWYADIREVFSPLSNNEIKTIDKKYIKIDGIVTNGKFSLKPY